MNKVLQNNLSQIPHTPQIFSVIKQFCLIWTKFVQFPRAACSIPFIACGDVSYLTQKSQKSQKSFPFIFR